MRSWSESSLGVHVRGKFADVSAHMYVVFVVCFFFCSFFCQNHKILSITYVLCDCIPCIMVHDWWINILSYCNVLPSLFLFLSLALLYNFFLPLGDDTKWPTRIDIPLNKNSTNQLQFLQPTLAHWILETPKRVTGKQCRSRSDAAECGMPQNAASDIAWHT